MRDRTTIRPTIFGLAVTALVVIAGILRPPVADPSVVGLVWAGLVGAVAFGVIWPVITVRALRITIARAPTDLVVSELSSLELHLEGRASGVSVGCTGQAMKVLDVVSPGSVRVPFTVAHRGAYRRIRIDLGSDAPFGIVSVTRSRLVDLPRQLLVGPVPERIDVQPGHLIGEQTAPSPSGSGHRGEAVRSVRPYVTGDPSHLVHWPSTARTGALVVRELEPPAAEALAVVVDLRATGEVGERHDERVEGAASRAAGLAGAALTRGARVLLCTSEIDGPVTAEVGDALDVQRRLALAVDGEPPEPPQGWPVRRVAPSADQAPPAAVTATPQGDLPIQSARRRRRTSPDRHTISDLRVWLLTALVGAQLWAALSALPNDGRRTFAAEAAALCAVLAMFGLRSVPIRWIVRGVALLSGLLLARFGELGVLGGISGSWKVLVWLAAAAAALALAPSSRSVPGGGSGLVVNALDVPGADHAGAGTRPKPQGLGTVPVALLVAAVALMGASSLLLGPRVGNAFPVGSKAGDVIDFGDARGDNVLAARDSLDMTSRPRLSERVVMSVRSPLVAFWRTEVFDEWDGSRWSRSRGREGGVIEGGRVVPDADDLAARRGESSTQEFRLEAGYATALPSAASPVRVEADAQLVQRSDGTLVSPFDPLGSGTTYTVESRQVRVDPDRLRATSGDDVPAAVRDRYAQASTTTERVAQLARDATAGASNDYDRIRALERWMDDNTRYSLDAPLSPAGVDVVDHFLFTERLGWCEQIASSLVVMARSLGIPARLAVGFAPGDWDPVGNRFVVRERDAHAWAEVWFPEAGWVAFDPTAEVPLAGTAEATAGAAARDWREIGGALLLALGVVALSASWIRGRVRRIRERRRASRRRRNLVRTRWDVAEEERLERLGASMGRPRGPGETVTAYASALAELSGDRELEPAGVAVDRERYGAGHGSSMHHDTPRGSG